MKNPLRNWQKKKNSNDGQHKTDNKPLYILYTKKNFV